MKPAEKNYYKNETLANIISAVFIVFSFFLYLLLTGGQFTNISILSNAVNYIARVVSTSSYLAKIIDDIHVWRKRRHQNILHFSHHKGTFNGVEEEKNPHVSKELIGSAIGFFLGITAGIVFCALHIMPLGYFPEIFDGIIFVFSMGGLVSAVFARVCRMFDPQRKYDDTIPLIDILKQQLATKISIMFALAASLAVLLCVGLLAGGFVFAGPFAAVAFIAMGIIVTAGMISGLHYVGRLFDALITHGIQDYFIAFKNLFHRGDSKIEREKLWLLVGLVAGIAVAAVLISPIGPPLLLSTFIGLSIIAKAVSFITIVGGITGVFTRLFGRTQDQRHELQKKERWMLEKYPEKKEELIVVAPVPAPASSPSSSRRSSDSDLPSLEPAPPKVSWFKSLNCFLCPPKPKPIVEIVVENKPICSNLN